MRRLHSGDPLPHPDAVIDATTAARAAIDDALRRAQRLQQELDENRMLLQLLAATAHLRKDDMD